MKRSSLFFAGALFVACALLWIASDPAAAQQTISGSVIRAGTTPLSALSSSGAGDQQVAQWSESNNRWQPGTAVTSVGLSLPSIFSVTGSPITGTGMITVSLASENALQFLGVGSSAGVPSFQYPNNLEGIPVKAGTPSDGQVLTYVAAHGDLEYATPSGGGGGDPTIAKSVGAGGNFSLNQSYTEVAFGSSPTDLTVTAPGSGAVYCHVTGNLEITGSTGSNLQDLRAVLHDDTSGGFPALGEARASSSQYSPGTGTYRIVLPVDWVGPETGGDALSLWATSNTSVAGSVTSYRSWLKVEQVSSSSATTQQSLPSLPATPVSWYKPSSLTGANGSNVTSWADSGSAGLNATASSNYPTLVVDAWNGLNAVSWSSGSVSLATESLPSSSTAFDLFVVVRAYSGTVASLIAHIQGGTSNGYQLNSTTTSYQVEVVYQGVAGWGATTTTGIVPNNGWYVLELQRTSGGSSTLYINGTSEATSSDSLIAPTGILAIGGPPASSTTMEIGEVILFSSALSSTNQAIMYSYLNSEWDL